jgi:hypothetical protein
VFKIDFEGWRYVSSSIRERTAAEAMRWTWEKPVRGYGRYLSELNMLNFAEVNIYLNNLPQGGKVDLSFTELRMVNTFDVELSGMVMDVGGVRERVPFAVKSGEWASRSRDRWTHWSKDGDLIATAGAARLDPVKGRCDMSLSVAASRESPSRARVCTFALGEEIAALKVDERVRSRFPMAYEAQTGEMYAPQRGCTEFAPVKIRPGESARVEFRFVGPVKGGVLFFAGEKFPVKDLGKDEEYLLKLPGIHSGVQKYSFEAEAGDCRIGAVKRYVRCGQEGETK